MTAFDFFHSRYAKMAPPTRRKILQGGRLLGIGLVDHIIVGDGTTNYFSFADAGLLDPSAR